MSAIRTGDVLSYVPRRSHCREGTAFVVNADRVVDTYWRPFGDGESHVLTEQELTTAEVRFNVHDFDVLDSSGARRKWETYHPDDRSYISSQHGLREVLFVRRGATPDMATQILNAEGEVAESVGQAQFLALSELVRLKDGPRDDAYREAKDAAWQRARDVLAFSQERPS